MARRLKDIDYDALHQYLWTNSGRNGRIVVNQERFAEGLDITTEQLSDLLDTMIEQHRLVRKSRSLFVVDPDKWKWEYATGPLAWTTELS